MHGQYQIEGLAIASLDGNIADHTGLMPSLLKLEADQALFEEACGKTDVLIHGRKSHEGQAKSYLRRRLIMTRQVKAIEAVAGNPNARLWNPAGATLDVALAALGCSSGLLGILGGPEVYSYFLPLAYDSFVLCRAVKVTLPGGVPVFSEMRHGLSVEAVLEKSGLQLLQDRQLDEEVRLTVWTPS